MTNGYSYHSLAFVTPPRFPSPFPIHFQFPEAKAKAKSKKVCTKREAVPNYPKMSVVESQIQEIWNAAAARRIAGNGTGSVEMKQVALLR